MPILPLAIFLVFILLGGRVCGQQTGANSLKTDAPQTTPAVLYSPDREHSVAWVDVNPGAPMGETRRVVFRSVPTSAEDIFSFVTFPGHTRAAWNSASTRCVIGDQPDNGSVFVWLVYKEEPDQWLRRKLDPLAPVYAAYRRVAGDKDTPLFRPYLDKIEWLTDTQVQFLVSCNLGGHEPAAVAGRYLVTFDLQTPGAAPTMAKVSDQ